MSFKKDILRIQKKTIESLESLQTRRDVEKVAKETVEIVRRRSRLGFGADKDGGPRKKFKKLKKDYIKQRKKDGRLSSETSPSKSNITRTGQLLNSLRYKLSGRNSFNIAPGGRRSDSRVGNKTVGKYVERERPFLSVSKNDIKQIEQFLFDVVLARVKKNLTQLK